MNSKPSCSDPETFEPLVDALASGPMTPEDERKVIQHLEECPSCQEQYREAVRFFLLYRMACPPEGAREQVERIKAGVQRKIRSIRRRRRLATVAGLAAGIALVVWSATLMTPSQPEPVAVENVVSAADQIEEPAPVPAVSEEPQIAVEEPTGTGQSDVTQDAQPDPYAGLTPSQTYGTIWQESMAMVYSFGQLPPEQKAGLRKRAAYLESVLKKTSLHAPAWNHLVRMYEKLGDLESADGAFDGFLKALGDNPARIVEALADRGDRLLRQGATLQAVKHYSHVINEHPDAPGSERAWYGLGRYYLEAGDSGQAIAYFSHVCENYKLAAGTVRDAHYTLANVLSNSGRYAEAIRAMQALMERAGGPVGYAELRIGDFYRYQGKLAKAVQAYRRVLAKYQTPDVRNGAEFQLARLNQAALSGALP